MADWENLPEIILAEIFSRLPTTDRLSLGRVCPSWECASRRPEVWKTFVYSDEDAVILFNGYLPDREIKEAFTCLIVNLIKTVGKHFKHVRLYFRGSESGQVLNSLAQYCYSIVELKIQSLTKAGVVVIRNHDCSSRQAVLSLLQRNRHLRKLDVRDLDKVSVTQHKGPLPIGASHALSLQSLSFLQSFQGNNLSNLMYLVNLRELAIEPHALSYSLLQHLAGNSLKDLHIVAISNHLEYYNEALQNWQWQEICKRGPQLRVHCHFGVGQEWTEKEIILKEDMPVKSIKYLKHRLLGYPKLSDLICKYSATLEDFIDFSMSLNSYKIAQQWIEDHQFDYSVNQSMFDIVKCCPKLHTFAVKEVLCSGTVLVMLYLNKTLNILLMEEQMKYSPVLPSGVTLPEDVRELIVKSSTNCADFEKAALQLSGEKWHFLLSSEFYDTLLQSYLPFV